MAEIYLDNGATTALSEGVMARMTEVMRGTYGNPSSLHRKGQEAEKVMEDSRRVIADYLRVDPRTIYFTSGGTESANTAILGAAYRNRRLGKHILTVRGEHPATSETLRYLADQGYEVEYIDSDAEGRAILSSLQAKLRSDTVLVACLHVNNETGVIQPIAEMGRIIKLLNPKTFFYVDAVQSFAKMQILPDEWKIDLLSASAHKFHGPKGVGCLYVRRGLQLPPYIRGGGQENKLRSGTENVPGIAGMAEAVREAVEDMAGHDAQMRACKMRLYKGICEAFPEAVVNGPSPETGASHVLNMRFPGIRSEVLLHALEDYGIFVSSGSACASNKPEEKSPALSALGLSRDEMDQSLRFSFSRYNQPEEMDEVVRALQQLMPRLRRFTRR